MEIHAKIRGFTVKVNSSMDGALWIWIDEHLQQSETFKRAIGVEKLQCGQHVVDTQSSGGNIGWIETFVPASAERERFVGLLSMRPAGKMIGISHLNKKDN